MNDYDSFSSIFHAFSHSHIDPSTFLYNSFAHIYPTTKPFVHSFILSLIFSFLIDLLKHPWQPLIHPSISVFLSGYLREIHRPDSFVVVGHVPEMQDLPSFSFKRETHLT